MKITALLYCLTILLLSCNSSSHSAQEDYILYKITGEDEASAYVNSKGDTIVPFGKYLYSFSDTIKTFGTVMNSGGKIIGIDGKANELFEIFKYDNGPDYLSDGLFRIIKNGKIGYASESGQIIIDPIYSCAYPFENGKAKVAEECSTAMDGEHSIWESEAWFHITKTGSKVE